MAKAIPETGHIPTVDQRPLHLDEPVWYAKERDENVPGVGRRRIQTLWVRRGEYEHTFKKDLGVSLSYPFAHDFNFMALGLYNAGEVMEICDRCRENQPEPEAPSDLLGQWFESLDEKRQQRAHRSVFGPAQRIQRN